ncbi:long-chain-fatty-acid--CoA ligase [Acidovorax sp. JHL-9]|uniref:long-chain-fatty-acid--CoA ligase n=1 Tax=Acidovorax sp. JHL-9 TaxID=1276756 RepID=UPI00041091A8|nr:long-chain-fatty-acid--CoA ligase [Acidovorax sp. JHL-9]
MVSLSASVAYWARLDPERLAIVYEDQRISYGDLMARVHHLAAHLRRQGIQSGDVVALLMKNSAAFMELTMAIGHVGAVVLPLNYRLSAAEVGYIVQHAGATLLFVDEELAHLVAEIDARVLVDAQAQRDMRLLTDGAASIEETIAHPSTPDDLFRLMYTSGTTDRPKGVMHTYSNFHWKNIDHIAVLGLGRDDRILVVGPLYHVGAFDLPGVAVLQMGGSMVILRDFDPVKVLATIERERITCGWMAPVMLNRTLNCPERMNYRVDSLRWIVGGGEKTPEERIREFTSYFTASRYIDAYGLTESCSGDTFMEPGREIEKIGSTGRATLLVRLEIRDDEGRSVPVGVQGEICLSGPKVTKGYWRDPVKTAATFHADGWLRTGDLGYLDADGFLFLTDRMKDMIISGGENIASSEVERVLYQMTEVAEAAVIGLPDEQWGERVVAVVVVKEGAQLDYQILQAHCRRHLAGFKVPKQLVCLESLPRNPSGKMLKRVLRTQLAGSSPSTA